MAGYRDALTNWLSILSRFLGFHRTEIWSQQKKLKIAEVYMSGWRLSRVAGDAAKNEVEVTSLRTKKINLILGSVLNENCIEDNIRQRSLDVSESHQWMWFCDDQRPHLRSGPRRSEGISIAKREVPGLRPGRMPTKRWKYRKSETFASNVFFSLNVLSDDEF